MDEDFQKIKNGDLYILLELSSKEDLDPLVTVILKKTSNSLDINEDYKKFKPDHTKYYKTIADEIRLFGGNSIRNLFRGGEGPPYDEIVIDVCRKLGVPFEKGHTLKNEANLLDIFVEQRWNSLSLEERKKLTEEASRTAVGKISDVAAIGKAGAIFVLGRVAFGPVGWVALGINVLDAAYKVTIPCVLHISYLRRRFLEERKDTTALAVLRVSKKAPPTLKSTALTITAEDNEPVLSLARIQEPPDEAAWHNIDRSDDSISRLNPLLQSVPSLVVAGEVMATNYMQVIKNGDKLLKTKEGILKAVTVGDNNKFSGIAEVIEPNRLAAMVNVSALMNVASIVVAQKHLADISKKLGEIKEAIGDIRQHLRDERQSKMTGSIRYFEQVAPSVLEGELPDRVLNQIEHHEAELLQVEDHLRKDLRAKIEALRNLKNDEWFGSGDTTQAIEKLQEEINELYRELILCIRARSCGWQLLCVFPGDEKSKMRRRQDIQHSLESLTPEGEMLTMTDTLLRKRIHELSSSWNKEITINDRKLALLKANEMLLQDVATCRADVQRDLSAADEMLTALSKPLAMAVRIEDGRITGIRAL